MQANADWEHKLCALLKQECDTLARLDDALSQERDALERRDMDAVVRLAQEKQILVTEVERLTRARLPLWRTYEATGEKKDAIDGYWQQLAELARRCFRANEINGRIIQASRYGVERSLQLLRNQSPDPAMTYNPKGQPNAQMSSLRAVKA
jgi:flagellar biosynthesis/type III secretory pathway chaperone